MEGGSNFGHWDELAPDLLGLIFKGLSFKEVIQVIPVVCKSWCKVVEGPYCWQRIDTNQWSKSWRVSHEKRDRMLQTLVMRSSGSLRELIVSLVKSEHMLVFIAEHAASLQTLEISYIPRTDSTVEQDASKFSSITKALEAIGSNGKNLMSLSIDWHDAYKRSDADEARTIACSMPKLKHLTVGLHIVKTQDVLDILPGFPEIESLNINCCWDKGLDKKLLEEKYPMLKVTVDDNYYSYDQLLGADCYLDLDDESHNNGLIHYDSDVDSDMEF